MRTPTRRRPRGIISNLDAPGPEPALHLGLNPLELLSCTSLEAHHEHGPGVGCPDQSPSFPEQHADPIDRNHFIPRAEVLPGFVHDAEFPVVWTIDADLGR